MMTITRILPLALVISSTPFAMAQNIGINVNGAAPAASALLDIDASALPAANKRGLLIPQMALRPLTNCFRRLRCQVFHRTLCSCPRDLRSTSAMQLVKVPVPGQRPCQQCVSA